MEFASLNNPTPPGLDFAGGVFAPQDCRLPVGGLCRAISLSAGD